MENVSANSYRNYYDWLAPKLSSEERKALDVIYEAANSSSGPNCSEQTVSESGAIDYKRGYEYLQDRLESIGYHGWAHDMDEEIRRTQSASGAIEPPRGLLLSIALRLDHGLLLPDQPPDRQRRIEAALSDARKVWEEVTGRGFWSPERNEAYEAMEREGISAVALFQIAPVDSRSKSA